MRREKKRTKIIGKKRKKKRNNVLLLGHSETVQLINEIREKKSDSSSFDAD